MQYPLPQFIEREARIVGPLTFRQAAYLGAAGGLILLVRAIFPSGIAWLLTIFLALGALALAFVEVSGRPLPTALASTFRFFFSTRRYLWQKEKFKANFPVITSEPKAAKKTELSEDDRALMQMAPVSRLDKLKSKIETKK